MEAHAGPGFEKVASVLFIALGALMLDQACIGPQNGSLGWASTCECQHSRSMLKLHGEHNFPF